LTEPAGGVYWAEFAGGRATVLEAAIYLGSAFWLGALHAATPGHGKTVAAAYLVGNRGRAIDAITLGVIVTLSHTGGIVLFALLALLGSSALLPRQAEGWLALGTGLLIVGLGVWMLWTQRRELPWSRPTATAPVPAFVVAGGAPEATLAADHGRGEVGVHNPAHWHDHGHPHDHDHDHTHAREHAHDSTLAPPRPYADGVEWHSHGWGRPHTHRVVLDADRRPSFALLLGLGIAGGIMPDPAALAVLLSAVASGKLVVGLLTVLVFSLGFASVLVAVGLVAARVGRIVLDRLGDGTWTRWVQLATSVLVIGVGVALTYGAWQTLDMLV
jgi:nickel/cobalt transporter (NicO) family protein